MTYALRLLLLFLCGPIAAAQLPPGTSDATASSSSTTPDAAKQASDALERGDYRRAEQLLQPLAQKAPADAHVLFDLGAAQDALDEVSAAEDSYKKATATDPAFFEPRLALGLMLARHGREADARRELLAAVQLPPAQPPVDSALRARAYRALAHLDENSDPAAARDELLEAVRLSPVTPEDDRLSAALAARAQDPAAAEAAYRRILAREPNDPAAAAGLARLLTSAQKLDEADALLTPALGSHPDDAGLLTSLALLRVRQQRPGEAAEVVATLFRKQPSDEVARLYANLLAQTGDYSRAEQVLDPVAQHAPADGPLLDQRADALIHLKRFAEAEHLLQAAIQHPASFPDQAALGEAAGHLAFAAFSNHDPQETLRALALRATFLPQSPSTLYLGAAAHDSLHHVRESRELYRQFLAAAGGKFPDEETEARHRLQVLEHTQ